MRKAPDRFSDLAPYQGSAIIAFGILGWLARVIAERRVTEPTADQLITEKYTCHT